MKISYFTPISPIKSGISQYSEELLPYLALGLDIDVYIDDYEPKEGLEKMFNIYSCREFEKRNSKRPYDLCLYHMGNNPYHFYMYPFMLKYPGVTVLHDFVLHHFYSGYYLARGDEEGYIREMEYNYGETGRRIAERRIMGIWTELQNFIYPLNKRIIDRSYGIIVHNDYAKNMIKREHPGALVRKVFMGMPSIKKPLFSKAAYKKKLGIPYDNFVIGSFGFVMPIKRVDKVVEAFKAFIKEVPHALLLIVGEISEHYRKVLDLIEEPILKKRVRVMGFVPEEEFTDCILASDVAVNLRYPTAGETSASLLRVMGMGVPVLVSNYRQFAEIPDGACIKINLGHSEVEEIRRALMRLAGSKTLRKDLAEGARNYVATRCTLEGAAEAYTDFLDEVLGRKASFEVLDGLRKDFLEAGITDEAEVTARLRDVMKDLGIDGS